MLNEEILYKLITYTILLSFMALMQRTKEGKIAKTKVEVRCTEYVIYTGSYEICSSVSMDECSTI